MLHISSYVVKYNKLIAIQRNVVTMDISTYDKGSEITLMRRKRQKLKKIRLLIEIYVL